MPNPNSVSRNTKQRIAILHYLLSVRNHPTAEMAYQAIRRKVPGLTLATVYRNLHLLASQGRINRLSINNEYHFDGFTHPHQHLVCTTCNNILDVENPSLDRYAQKRLDCPTFKTERIMIQAFGICAQCQ